MGLYIPYMGLFQWRLTIISGILGHSCSDTAQLCNPWVNEPLGSSSSLLYLYVFYFGHMRLPLQNWANCLLFIVYWLVVWNMTFIFHNICNVMLPLDELICFKIVIAPPASLPHWVFHIACDLRVIWCKILPAWDTWEYDPATKQNLLIAISLWSGHKPKTPRLGITILIYIICNM